MSKIKELTELGQSIWYDYIRRSFLTRGELKALIDEGLRGETSNPSILEKAIAGSSDYDEDLKGLVEEDKSVDEIYEALVLKDIAMAADEFRPLYEETDGRDGFISLEVSPTLANNTKQTIKDAKRYFVALDRPNVMIKVPATPAGLPAITELIGSGINVNVTLMFSLDQYKAVAEAYLKGLERLAADGPSVFKGRRVDKVASVASFFVSRVDGVVDAELEKIGNTDLLGKIAIANSKITYEEYQRVFKGPRWKKLADLGARPQRVLWASTSTKNLAYPDTLYVDELIGPNTVNTVPPATYKNFRDHGNPKTTLTKGLKQAHAELAKLEKLGIKLNDITDFLLQDGVKKFAESFETLMQSIADKKEQIQLEKKPYTASLGKHQAAVDKALEDIRKNNIIEKIWNFDYLVWEDNPTDISNRLGWLHIPEVMADALPGINAVVDKVREEGYTNALLLGMGGSSLAVEVIRETYGVKDGYLDVAVLDSTDPGMILDYRRSLDMKKTLFIVSTKSGGTAETLSYMKYFYNETLAQVGKKEVGKHFVAITDPGSGLEKIAKDLKFRKTFLNDPNIGGRYSALSFVGIPPAAFQGVDVPLLLERSIKMLHNNESCNCAVEGDHSGAWLGAIMGELTKAGHDKVTLITSPPIQGFGAWAEQLIAESTGKIGKGILPVDCEPIGPPENYANDRLFVYLRLANNNTYDTQVKALEDAGHPVVRINLKDIYDLGGEFFRWEMAISIAGRIIGIHPFNQPNVEAAKILARNMIAEYMKKGTLPYVKPTLEDDGITVYSEFKADSAEGALKHFLSLAKKGKNEGKGRSYVTLQAYVKPDDDTYEAMQKLRKKIQNEYRLATTSGFGPRFLHSTGQLHKGDAGNGLFIQFTSEMPEDAPIPDEAGKKASSMSFGVLKNAQALGDRQALLDNKRNVITFHLGEDVVGDIERLTKSL
ncbi:MAG: bifunctional transaldolase/phosoglucose isomerase [Thermodesulfobacteriales bacterium]|nr:MAG: bifunctional transaldolase/phosoglucose isomerase [Thermodesulfobacteriales bacterium]